MDRSWAVPVACLVDTITQLVGGGLEALVSNPALFSLPQITSGTAIPVCSAVSSIFETEPTLLDLQGDFVIIGDLHGHVLDLLRILIIFGLPPATKYILLGDVVDKGEFSVHTCLYLFALKCRYPRSIYIIRGNHELEEINTAFGLLAEIREDFRSTEIHAAFNQAFSFLPLAVRLNRDILCLHGGIGPDLVSLDQLAGLARPLVSAFSDPICDAVLWSDPNPDVDFRPNQKRNKGFEFGEKPLAEFLARNRLTILIRGHSFVQEGVRVAFHGSLITVHSASICCDAVAGSSGVIVAKEGRPLAPEQFPSLPTVFRHRMAPPPTAARPRKPIKDLDTTQRASSAGIPPKRPPIVSMPFRARGVAVARANRAV
jgi:diadenosine tetraphosphatase ApaH/serine/threonine PP2A family protein phosphatase